MRFSKIGSVSLFIATLALIGCPLEHQAPSGTEGSTTGSTTSTSSTASSAKLLVGEPQNQVEPGTVKPGSTDVPMFEVELWPSDMSQPTTIGSFRFVDYGTPTAMGDYAKVWVVYDYDAKVANCTIDPLGSVNCAFPGGYTIPKNHVALLVVRADFATDAVVDNQHGWAVEVAGDVTVETPGVVATGTYPVKGPLFKVSP